MIQLAVPAKLYQFKGSRLPLGTPVTYKGRAGVIAGRSYMPESYDIAVPGEPLAWNVKLAEIVVDMKGLAGGDPK
jgi:hypothetical protein